MAYDLEEQEQLDELKAWWKTYGKMVSNLVVGLLVAYAAYQGWTYYQTKQAVNASTEYQALQVVDTQDTKSIQAKAAVLMEKYSATPYAGRAAVLAAKANYEANQIKSAKAQLEWAISNAKETSVSAIASLQLANILAEENNFDAALKVLEAKHDAGFDGLFLDLKGDVLLGLGKRDEAKAAYELALTKLDAQGRYRHLTQQKIDSLG